MLFVNIPTKTPKVLLLFNIQFLSPNLKLCVCVYICSFGQCVKVKLNRHCLCRLKNLGWRLGDGREEGNEKDQDESRNEIETDGPELSVLDLFIRLD